ncbi:MAG TPA: 16S rRNA (cytidine(1402)-2'-O)-methyltransferase [Acidimicrobiales bacterium]
MSAPAPGELLLVATPIGNLGDLSPRACEVLREADLICCEDTRRTRALLSAAGIPAGGAQGDRLLSLHGHNESSRVERVQACLDGGGKVAVVSDAGTPGISDPGSLLVAALLASGHTVRPVPGPTSVIAALAVSGLPTDRFCVEGFLPRKGAERRERLAAVMTDQRTTVILEAPGRVAATLRDLSAFDEGRPVAVARELTKVHEEVWHGTVAEGVARYDEVAPRGEVVLVVGGAPQQPPLSDDEVEDVVRARLATAPDVGARQMAEMLSLELGVGRRRVYEAALRVREQSGSG